MVAGLMIAIGTELCEVFSQIASRLLRQLTAIVQFFPCIFVLRLLT